MPNKAIIRLSGVARNPANGFPARLLGQSFDQMILQRQWAQEELEARVQDRTAELVEVNEVMDLVDEVARIVTSTLNIGEVYEKFTQELKKLVNFDRASINVIDQEAGTATLKFLFGPARAGHAVGTVSSLQDSENQTVLETGQTLLREDAAVVQYAADLGHANNGLRAAVRVPLISNGKIFGTISLRSREVDVYGPREQAILERLAEQIAPAIENSQLYGQLQASMEEMALADEVARIVTSTLDIGEVYEKFALEVKKLVDFDVMNINLIDREAADFTTRYLVGGGPARAPTWRYQTPGGHPDPTCYRNRSDPGAVRHGRKPAFPKRAGRCQSRVAFQHRTALDLQRGSLRNPQFEKSSAQHIWSRRAGYSRAAGRPNRSGLAKRPAVRGNPDGKGTHCCHPGPAGSGIRNRRRRHCCCRFFR